MTEIIIPEVNFEDDVIIIKNLIKSLIKKMGSLHDDDPIYEIKLGHYNSILEQYNNILNNIMNMSIDIQDFYNDDDEDDYDDEEDEDDEEENVPS